MPPPNDQSLDQFIAMLRQWADDPEVATSFHGELGPAGTLRIASQWSMATDDGHLPEPSESQREVLALLRTSVEAASHGWHPAHASEFGRSLGQQAISPALAGGLLGLIRRGRFRPDFIVGVIDGLAERADILDPAAEHPVALRESVLGLVLVRLNDIGPRPALVELARMASPTDRERGDLRNGLSEQREQRVQALLDDIVMADDDARQRSLNEFIETDARVTAAFAEILSTNRRADDESLAEVATSVVDALAEDLDEWAIPLDREEMIRTYLAAMALR